MMIKIDTHNGWFRGLGDLVCFAWIGATLQAAEEDVEFYAHGWRAELLGYFGQCVAGDATGGIVPEVGYAEAVRTHSPLSYVEWIASQCGNRAAELFQRISTKQCKYIRPRLNLPPMPREMGRAASSRVLLFPECAWPVRAWPLSYWLELARLLRDAGIDLAIVTEKRREEFGAYRCIYDHPLSFIAAAMQRADLVIGGDSGPAHLAGTIGTQTLAIHGPTTERIFAHIPEVISHRQQALACAGCEYLAPFRESCRHGCHELYRTYPEEVCTHALQLLGVEIPPSYL